MRLLVSSSSLYRRFSRLCRLLSKETSILSTSLFTKSLTCLILSASMFESKIKSFYHLRSKTLFTVFVELFLKCFNSRIWLSSEIIRDNFVIDGWNALLCQSSDHFVSVGIEDYGEAARVTKTCTFLKALEYWTYTSLGALSLRKYLVSVSICPF